MQQKGTLQFKFVLCFTVDVPSCSEVVAGEVFQCPEVHGEPHGAGCQQVCPANTAGCALIRHRPKT